MHRLFERPATFDYAYNMTCPSCPDLTFLADEDYALPDDEAHIACAHRDAGSYVGPGRGRTVPRNLINSRTQAVLRSKRRVLNVLYAEMLRSSRTSFTSVRDRSAPTPSALRRFSAETGR